MGAGSGRRRAGVALGCAVACLLGTAAASVRASGAPTLQAPTVCPPQSSAPTAPPSPPPTVVACVGSREITLASFEHWSEVAKAAPGPQPPSTHEIVEQVMGFLLSVEWVRGEARARHVHVAPAVVRRKFEHLRKLQFHKLRQFRTFLRKTKETVADILMRIEVQLLAGAIQKRVTAGKRGPKAQGRALSRFAERFQKKWKRSTYCAPAYAIPDCGHVQESL